MLSKEALYMIFQRQGFSLLRKKEKNKKSLQVQLKTTPGDRAGIKTQVCPLKACVISPEPCGSLLGKVPLATFAYTMYSTLLILYNLTNSEKLEGRESDEYESQPEFYRPLEIHILFDIDVYFLIMKSLRCFHP